MYPWLQTLSKWVIRSTLRLFAKLYACNLFHVLLSCIFIDKSLFDMKRREQIETAERVWNIDDYAKRYKAVAFVIDTIFPVSPWYLLDRTAICTCSIKHDYLAWAIY